MRHIFRGGLALACLLLAGYRAWAQTVTIESFTPSIGTTNDRIMIVGSGFSVGTIKVRFWNNVLAFTDPPPSDTILYAYVPAGAVTGRISVQRDNGQQVFSTNNFTVIGQGPYVTGFSPASGSGGTRVFIDGLNFTGATAVKFNGVDAAGGGVTSDTLIEATAPANVSTGPITVVTPKGSFTTATNFFVPPFISSFSPVNGRTGTNVVVKGKNLLGTTTVWFNDVPTTAFTVNSTTQLSVTVPLNAKTGPLGVDTPADSFFTSSNYVVRPTLHGFTPNFGAIGSSITLTGANFNVGTPVVRFNGVQAAAPTGISFGQMTVKVPSGASTGPISVSTTDGSHTNDSLFHVPASITGFSPTNSAPGSAVVVTGQNLLGATEVRFGSLTASFAAPTNNTTLVATVPADVITGPISVVTPAGTATSSLSFYGAPLIVSFTPTHGLPGTNVTIIGTNFLGATAVRFNGTQASVSSVNNGRIVALVPNGASTGPISVEGPAGTNVSAAPFTLDYTSDLAIAATAVPNPVIVGSNLVYTLVITNRGPFNARNVRLLNTLHPTVLLKSAGTTLGTLDTNSNPVVANLGALTFGSAATVTLTVAPLEKGAITNLAVATSDYTDPVATNSNISTVTTVLPLPLLSIRKSSPTQVQVSWPVELTNYVLQYRPLLVTTNNWSNLTVTPVISGSTRSVTDSNTLPARFYRLKK